MKNDKTALFETMPVGKALLTMAIPTIVSQLITMIYNMADTFFIGLSDDPYKVAAASIVGVLFFMVKGTAVVGTPKSRDSYRVIPVPPVLQKYAIALRDTKQKYVWEAGKKDSPCNPSYFRKQFKTALAQIPEVRELTPHSCRHTYVSQMQALGVDLATIQSIVGHADTDMTQHYLHVQKSIQQTAVNRYSELLSVE